jgi:hypothetical protein
MKKKKSVNNKRVEIVKKIHIAKKKIKDHNIFVVA